VSVAGWVALLCIGLVAIGVRSWWGDMACEGPSTSEFGESHWSYREFGHHCTFQGVRTTEPSGLGRVWIATVAVGALGVAGAVATCVTPPRRTRRRDAA
jgi:hypothetical protein